MRPQVKATELKWDVVEKGAREILKAVDSARYTAPEEAQIPLNRAVTAMNAIAEALCLTTLGGSTQRKQGDEG